MRETPRQFLIKTAAHVMRTQDVSADTALNIVASEGRTCEAGSYGAEARRYFLACSDTAHGRLIATVTREAKQ